MFLRCLTAVLCLVATAARAQTVVASIYWPGDGIVPRNDYATSSGQRYDPKAMRCASPELPLGTRLILHHGHNAAEVVINDRGPFIKHRRLDCTPAVNDALHLDGLGTVAVEFYPPLPQPRRIP